nr:hypothetical protein [Pantoea sp. 1.19]
MASADRFRAWCTVLGGNLNAPMGRQAVRFVGDVHLQLAAQYKEKLPRKMM